MKTRKILIVIIMAIVLCLVFALGAFAGCQFFNKDNDDVQNDDTQNEDKNIVADGGMVTEEENEEHGIALLSFDIPRELYDAYDILPIAESAKQLTATITPAEATNKKVDWTVAWKNPSSTWASGKTVTSYVTVTATSDGALTANVSCLQAFGEQVIVKCTSRDNTDISASCTLDYVKRVSSIGLSLSGTNVSKSGLYYKVSCKSSVTATFSPTFTDGTLTGTFTGGLASTELTSALFTAAKNAVSNTSTTVFNQSSTTFFNANFASTSTVTATLGDCFTFIAINGNPYNVRSEWSKAFYNYVNSNQSTYHAQIFVSYTYAYNGTSYGTGRAGVGIIFDPSSVAIAVGNVSLDTTTYIF